MLTMDAIIDAKHRQNYGYWPQAQFWMLNKGMILDANHRYDMDAKYRHDYGCM